MKNVMVIILVAVLAACSGKTVKEKKDPDWNQAKSTKMNKDFTVDEDIKIRLYLSQHENWKVEETGSGLRYISMKAGSGELARSGQDARVQYKVSLLDGTECYKTDDDEVEVFRIDKSNIETGIQEGIKKMRVGEKAKLIIPSHIAHGLIGDLDKVPPLAPIVVDIELFELK